jgi:hypothetical protein
MALPRMRHLGGTRFAVPGGHEIFVTNKYSILSGPEEWLAPVGLASLAHAMRAANDEDSDRLYISTDPPDKFDDRYPDHLLDVFLERTADDKRIAVGLMLERDLDEEDSAHEAELRQLLAPLISRYAGSNFEAWRESEFEQPFFVRFELPVRGRTIGEAFAIGTEGLALVEAAQGGSLTLRTAVDLIRSGRGAALIGQQEGPWFDGKAAPYLLSSDDKKWELAKGVASFANSETGGVIFMGAMTKRVRDGDVVSAVTDFELSSVKPPQYRGILAARIHPLVEGLEIRTMTTQGTRGTAYIYVPSQRPELKPFIVKRVVVAGSIRANHVCIPERDGEDTRFADPAEVHSLLQAGRVALRQA